MLISEKLQEFYIKNNLSEDGGENDDYFYLTFRLFSLKLPNSNFRKKVVYIHDIQHVLYNKDITWKGEAFIAGWEIATGLWKRFPINIMSLWAMGFSVLTHPKEVLKGYKEGLLVNGVIDLNISKKKLLNYKLEDLRLKMKKNIPVQFNWLSYLIFVTLSLVVVLAPLLLIVSFLALLL